MEKITPHFLRKLYNILARKNIGNTPIISSLAAFILNIYYKFLVKSKGDIIITEYEGIKIHVPTNDNIIGKTLILSGHWEYFETSLFKKFVKPGMTVIDIGASFGYYSLLAAKLVGDSGLVYAFEPQQNQYNLIVKSVELNKYDNVIPINKAVSNHTGKSKVFMRTNKAEEVDSITLDDFFNKEIGQKKVDFIKIDVDGFEGFVIDKAGDILKNDLKIIMEFWPEGIRSLNYDPCTIIDKLIKYGFSIKLIDYTNNILVDSPDISKICKDNKTMYMLFLEKIEDN